MLPAAMAAMTAAAGRGRQRLLAARRRAPGPSGGRGVPRERGRGLRGPPERGGVHRRGAPRRTTWRSRACSGRDAPATPSPPHRWPRAGRASRRARPARVAGRARGGRGQLAAGGPARPGRPGRRRGQRSRRTPGRVALVSVMWANNEVGTVQPMAEVVDAGAERRRPGPHRRRAGGRAAAGRLRRESALDAMTISAPQARRPRRASGPWCSAAGCDTRPAAARRRAGARRPLRNPGRPGDRRVRAPPLERAPRGLARARAARLAALRDELVRGGPRGGAGRRPERRSRTRARHRLPGNAHFSFPGCEGDCAAACCSTPVASRAPPGRPARPGSPSPATCCWRWGPSRTRRAAPCGSPSGGRPAGADVDALVAAIGPAVERARRAGPVARDARGREHAGSRRDVRRGRLGGGGGPGASTPGTTSPGSTSRSPGDRQSFRSGAPGLLHARGRPRRPPGRRRPRDPVLRLGPGRAVRGDVVDGLRRRVRRRPHPEPLPALQRADQVRCGPGPGAGAGLRRGVHRALRAPRGRPGRAASCTGRSTPDKDQSYVLGVLDARAAAPVRCSRWAGPPRRRCGPRRPDRGLAVADKPDSHDICFIPDGDTAGFLRRALGDATRAPSSTPTGTVVGRHEGAFAFTVGQRRGLRLGRPAADGRPRYVLDVVAGGGDRDGGPAERSPWRPSRRSGRAGADPPGRLARVQRPGAGPRRGRSPARRASPAPPAGVELRPAACEGVAPGQAVVLYLGTRVVGSATIERTGPESSVSPAVASLRARSPWTAALAAGVSDRHRVDARGPRSAGGCRRSSWASCPTCRTCPSCPSGARGPT